jgi:hypothetical protein
MQQGLLFHSLYAQNCGVDIEQIIFDRHENLNVSAFKQAWQKIAHRHPVLRASFHVRGEGEPLRAPAGENSTATPRLAHRHLNSKTDCRRISNPIPNKASNSTKRP